MTSIIPIERIVALTPPEAVRKIEDDLLQDLECFFAGQAVDAAHGGPDFRDYFNALQDVVYELHHWRDE